MNESIDGDVIYLSECWFLAFGGGLVLEVDLLFDFGVFAFGHDVLNVQVPHLLSFISVLYINKINEVRWITI